MKRLTVLLLLGALVCTAEEITLTKAAMLKAERSVVSLKAGTVVELVSRDESSLTIRYKNLTGKIPASSVADTAAETPKNEAPGKEAPKTVAKPEEKPVAPARKATTTYGKAVEKARENADKHDKNVVKPADEILGK